MDYEAICMRASQVGVHSSLERVQQISHQIQGAALNVSMVTGDFKVPMNNQFGPDGLRAITPYLNLAQSLGADLIRICMKKDDDIPWAQRASDEAIERGIRLAHQAHCASLFETIDNSLTVLKKVNRNNFGIIYEPANWMLAGENYGLEAIKRLQPFIFNVYVQNHRLNPNGKARVTTWGRGEVQMDHIGLWENEGVNFNQVFYSLNQVQYQGFITVHQSFAGVLSVEEAVQKTAEYLKPLIN